ncbi:MAG TPA: hypothetical protein PLD20_00780 [Blastocatellia bacterium]|nr:hypothetical protein [Blastocatellia bacterium]HMV81781.1 hypothetical protein [Blastocatellia bacterium]HMX24740.1 hypothetical protein [Blastocatellia bacterium]HMY70679.1 hypothetical protein [Blastocatellia bacterium]HMZ16469.1 hypothetical protein [Blastocatellia bacterium]
MNAHSPIDVMICCNDPGTGNFLGFLTGFNIEELEINCGWGEESPDFLFDGTYLVCGQAKFPYFDRRRHVGNICWDRITMPAEAVARLLNWARSNDFYWESSPSDFARIWDSDSPIKFSHLEMIVS